MKLRRTLFAVVLLLAAAALQAQAQTLADAESSSGTVAVAPPAHLYLTYTRPTKKVKLRNYLFDAFGPYPIDAAVIVGGFDQATKTPPEWRQGAAGYGERFGSAFAVGAVTTTTRYTLAQAFHEDTLYYRCECKGVSPRIKHALISSFTGRRGADGHRAFSFAAVVAPYVGTTTAVYGWYPDRYDAKDAFRMGSYGLLEYAASNLAIEFLYSGPHSWLSHAHLNNRHGAPDSDPTP
ncbi:MAG: hypothetical protein ABSG72_05780 [Candidatus Sulfotelmatobacter sp.]|jgi:hypothetical protein